MVDREQDIIYVSWRRFLEMMVELASIIKRDGYCPEMIIAVSKGGLIPARVLSDLIDVNEMGFIGVRFYKAVKQHDAKPELLIPPTPSVSGKKILVVDDIVDTGRTLQLVIDELYRYGAREVKTLALFIKEWATIIPDYYLLVTSKWVVFPWEIVETTKSIEVDEDLFESDGELYRLIRDKLLKT